MLSRGGTLAAKVTQRIHKPHDDVTMDDELVRQALRLAGRKGGRRRVRKSEQHAGA